LTRALREGIFIRMQLIRVEIASISLVPSGGGVCAIVLREVDGERFLPVVIGILEAQSISVRMQGIPTPRPLAHDLMCVLMTEAKVKLSRVVIESVKGGTFFAMCEFDIGGRPVRIDSRPSDAIALAVRLAAPVFVAESVMNKAGSIMEAGAKINPQQFGQDKPSEEPESEEEQEDLSPVEELEMQMDQAVKEEDYEKAAQIRDRIRKLREEGGESGESGAN